MTASPIDDPTALADLVDIQRGSVVSRVLMRGPGGTLTLFAFAEGEGLSEHSTPHEATLHVLEGEARVSVGDRLHTVRAGEILRLPASVPHALHGGAAFKMLLTILKSARE